MPLICISPASLLALDLAMYAGDLNWRSASARLNGPGASNNARLRLDALWLEV
jgi:hypothetical protein